MPADRATTEQFIDAIDGYLAFKREAAKGIDGVYYGYVYGHPEPNECYEKDREEVVTAIMTALQALFASGEG